MCTCEAVLRADAETLLAQADRLAAQRHTANAEVSRRQAMSLALAAGHLRRHAKEKKA